MTDKTLIEKLKIEKRKWENKIYGVGETRIDLMIDDVIKELQNQQEEINDLKWKNKIYVKSIKSHKIETEKKDTLIHIMQAEFERLEDLEDNTDMLKEELKKKDKIIDEAISWIKSLHDSLIEEYGDYETEFSIKGDNVEENEIKEYIISEVEKESKDDN